MVIVARPVGKLSRASDDFERAVTTAAASGAGAAAPGGGAGPPVGLPGGSGSASVGIKQKATSVAAHVCATRAEKTWSGSTSNGCSISIAMWSIPSSRNAVDATAISVCGGPRPRSDRDERRRHEVERFVRKT